MIRSSISYLETKFNDQILIYGISSSSKLGGPFINRYLSLENIFLCRPSYVFLEKCHRKGLFVQSSSYIIFL